MGVVDWMVKDYTKIRAVLDAFKEGQDIPGVQDTDSLEYMKKNLSSEEYSVVTFPNNAKTLFRYGMPIARKGQNYYQEVDPWLIQIDEKFNTDSTKSRGTE